MTFVLQFPQGYDVAFLTSEYLIEFVKHILYMRCQCPERVDELLAQVEGQSVSRGLGGRRILTFCNQLNKLSNAIRTFMNSPWAALIEYWIVYLGPSLVQATEVYVLSFPPVTSSLSSDSLTSSETLGKPDPRIMTQCMRRLCQELIMQNMLPSHSIKPSQLNLACVCGQPAASLALPSSSWSIRHVSWKKGGFLHPKVLVRRLHFGPLEQHEHDENAGGESFALERPPHIFCRDSIRALRMVESISEEDDDGLSDDMPDD